MTHQSRLDGLVAVTLIRQRFYSLVDREVFRGPYGVLLRNVGCFPVNKTQPGVTPLLYTKLLLESNKAVVWTPEGDMFRDGAVHPLKRGVEWVVNRVEFESIIPIAITIVRNNGFRRTVLIHIDEPLTIRDYRDRAPSNPGAVLRHDLERVLTKAKRIHSKNGVDGEDC
jgi:1-acyl-sn-glycerol-3-phosphate acyltransferase